MSRKSLYVGRSGQMAVMAEFLIRGYNVAVPEVDVGHDIISDRFSIIGLTGRQLRMSKCYQYRVNTNASLPPTLRHRLRPGHRLQHEQQDHPP